jgi:hypothetical protein
MGRRQTQRKSRELVLGYLERISSKVFSNYPDELTELAGDQHGVYALYKGDRLYYVGLATNLKNRIRNHLKDRHAGKWDKFSLYLVRKADHIRELESIIMRIAGPRGNAMEGKLPGAENLRRRLQANVKKAQRRQLDDIFTVRHKTAKGIRRTGKGSRAGGRGEPPLAPYVKKGFTIRREYKGKTYRAYVHRSGRVSCDGVLYNSPSEAAQAVARGGINGWWFWRFRNKDGEWVLLNELRK